MCGLPKHGGFKGAKRHDVYIQKKNIRHPIRHLERPREIPGIDHIQVLFHHRVGRAVQDKSIVSEAEAQTITR